MGCLYFIFSLFKKNKKSYTKDPDDEYEIINQRAKLIHIMYSKDTCPYRIVDSQMDFECPICLSIMKSGTSVCYVTCGVGHGFHRKCLDRWAEESNKCPICRYHKPISISLEIIFRIYHIGGCLFRLEYRFVEDEEYRIAFIPDTPIGVIIKKAYMNAFNRNVTWEISTEGVMDWRIHHFISSIW